MAYSADFKRRAVEYKQKGHTFKELKEVFGIHSSTYYQWAKEYENDFEKPKGPRQRSRKIDKEKLKLAVEEHPDFYLREFAELFGCSPQAIFYALKKLKITLKKKTFTYAEKSEEKRQEYLAELAKIPIDKRVYLDECGINRVLVREMGRALRGKIVPGTKNGKRSKRVNTIGALWNGIHVAVKSYLHSTTSEFFEQWFKEELLPVLLIGCTIIMDNASFHRKNKLREMAAEYGINVLFLPTYSPDLNPIETSWANLKQWLRDNIFTCPCLKEGRIPADKFIPLLVNIIPQYFES